MNKLSRITNPFDESKKYSESSEQSVLSLIQPLIEGSELYKKFSQRSSINQTVFDPLGNSPPESCGYGIRSVQLNKSLKRIDIRQPYKTGLETSITIDQIRAPVIPQRTMTILKLQKTPG